MSFVLPRVLINMVLGYLTDVEMAYLREWLECRSFSEIKRAERVDQIYTRDKINLHGMLPGEAEMFEHDYNRLLVEFVFCRYIKPLDIKESWNWLYERTCWCKNALLLVQNIFLFQEHLAKQLDTETAKRRVDRLWDNALIMFMRLPFLRALASLPALHIPTWVFEKFMDQSPDTPQLLILNPEVRFPQLLDCVARQAIRVWIPGWLKILAEFPEMKWTTSLCEEAIAHGNLPALEYLRSRSPPCPWPADLHLRLDPDPSNKIRQWIYQQPDCPPLPETAYTVSCRQLKEIVSMVDE